MGQQYDPTWQFTIADLYSFKLGLHKELINSICSGAVKEYALESNLRSLAKKWTEKDFKLTKHFSRIRTPLESETASSSGRNSSRKVCEVFFLWIDITAKINSFKLMVEKKTCRILSIL